MTQLLISVRNIEEALLALEMDVDIIDLKDPDVGALGALDLVTTRQILQVVKGQVLANAATSFHTLVSATVGERHASLSELVEDINVRAQSGVDIIKIGVSALFYGSRFFAEMSKLAHAGVKMVAVFFADEKLDLDLLPALQEAGFYGAMLDTRNKQQHLFAMQAKKTLHLFTQLCKKHHLKSGLAGSLKPQHIEILSEVGSTYIGFRGGVCENSIRNAALSKAKVIEVKNMLLIHNKHDGKAREMLPGVAQSSLIKYSV